ncbi:hypothetical protein H6A19_14295 [Clostridium saudiense]|uniref:Uncharacterized protein n=1 Tax=Clostridium saudiense TaxID=1414720 RepID=A0ABS2FKF0_9CLOT|nr:hypothetical protein [Clostridium saudiense]MBM6820487.1 hypothetical protein [Clostridium saudiense]
MIILYQVAIFVIIILSSFAGFKGLFISVCLIVGFSLSNIFTAKLLVIQFTTIVVSTVIGIIIATIKLILNMPRIINDKFNSIKEYFQEYRLIENKYLSQYLLRCGYRILTSFTTVSLIIILSEEFNINSDSAFIGIILVMGIIFSIFPVLTVNAGNGGFIEESHTFRFLVAIGCIFIGWKIAINLCTLLFGIL